MLHRIQHYNIIEELGKGGMGVVYKAEDTRLHRIVALKLLSSDSTGDPKARERFHREARIASSLQHQNICTIHEIGETSEGDLFISMDYYEGETLQQIISRGSVSLDLILNYAGQIAGGLARAHEKGIIHRDIKPGNIIVTQNGLVKILDFGLAKLAGKHDSTQTGRALGTIAYLSPEQAQGQKVDHLTDIWSLGVVLYEMVTGQLPFSHEYDAAVIYSILDTSPLPPTEIRDDVPEELERIIYRCLRKKKEERIQSAKELMQALSRIRENLEEDNGQGSGEPAPRMAPEFQRPPDESTKHNTSVLSQWTIRSEMVGREKELDKLSYYLLRLIQGEGYIINVIGEAGIGKSRLIAEFLQKQEISRVVVVEGRAQSSGLNLSFHPLIEIIRKLADIREADGEPEAYKKLHASIQRFCPDSSDEVFPFIATLMGITLTGLHEDRLHGVEGEGLEKLILKNLKTLIAGAANQHPIIFLVEDIHWADQSSIGLLKSIYRLAQNHPILFLNVFRPDYETTGERIREAIRDRYEKYQTEIVLDPLDETHSELLIRSLLESKTLPASITRLVLQRVEGNPFFIEEVIRNMIDERVILMDKNQAIVTKKTDALVIPETILEVLMARIERLKEETGTLVKLASVIGRQFFEKVLREVAGQEMDVDSILQNLIKIQMIHRRKRMDEVEFLFKHALIQQAAYQSIPVNQKKKLHFAVAEAIEKVFEERIHDFYGILAYHYSHAEELDKTESYLILAGERALRSSASHEALHYYKEALSIYMEKYGNMADPHNIAILHKYIGLAYHNTGHLIEAADYLGKVLDFHGLKIPKNPLVLLFKVISGTIILLFRIRFPSFMGKQIPTNRENEINDMIMKKASALVITDNKKFLIDMILFAPWITRYRFKNPESLIMAGAIFSMGGISLSIAHRFMDVYIAHSDQNQIKARVAGRFGKIVTDMLSGNWYDTPLEEKMVDQGLMIGESYGLVNYVAFKAHELWELGNSQAGKVLDKLSDLSEVYENDFGRLASYTHGSLYLLKYRKFEEARTRASEGAEFIRTHMGNKPGLLMSYSIKIRAQVMLGELDQAEETLRVAQDIARGERLSPYFHTFFLTASLLFETRMYEHLIRSNDTARLSSLEKQMIRTGKKAVKVCNFSALERVETYRLVGVSRWLSGKQGKAVKWWHRAIQEAEELGAKLELSLTLHEVSRRLIETGSTYKEFMGVQADSLRRKAETLFEEMNINTE